jgi:hypothetical protein
MEVRIARSRHNNADGISSYKPTQNKNKKNKNKNKTPGMRGLFMSCILKQEMRNENDNSKSQNYRR